MAESAALLVDEVLPEQPIRQWVLSFPYQLRFLFASRPEIMGKVLGIVYRAIAGHLIKKAGFLYFVKLFFDYFYWISLRLYLLETQRNLFY